MVPERPFSIEPGQRFKLAARPSQEHLQFGAFTERPQLLKRNSHAMRAEPYDPPTSMTASLIYLAGAWVGAVDGATVVALALRLL